MPFRPAAESLSFQPMRAHDLVQTSPAGLCCRPGGFHIDPLRPVDKALITHAHSDHARSGHGAVLATRETLDLMRLRLGEGFAGATQALAYGETITLGGVSVTFLPAGHVLGSAQILMEMNGFRAVASGDYKDVADPTCAAFSPVRCDLFVTEATFGLPVFRHGQPAAEIGKLVKSLTVFPERGHVVGVYALGKAQRLIALLRAAGYDRPVYLHGALAAITDYYAGVHDLGDVRLAGQASREDLAGAVVLAPPSALQSLWTRRIPEPVTAFASGWMRVRARARQRGVELPLVLSDHADWDGLTATIPATGAEEIWVTHGAEEALVHWCTARGLAARPLALVGYGEEDENESVDPGEGGVAS
jgi:putative mRNA 3-end processing factor